MNFISTITYLLEGALQAIALFGLTIVLSLSLGLLVAKLRQSKHKVIQLPVKLYLLVMRGTPLMLQLFFFMYCPSLVFGIPIDRFLAAVISFSLNYAAYFAEIYRGGIESIPAGQYEAASVLGLSQTQTFIRIILPQVIKRIIPACANECMTLVKDTALAQVIGVAELMRNSKNLMSSQATIIPLVIAGIFYLIMNSVVAMAFSKIEKKLNYYKG
jgi:polar amino acid transport system permease protein